MLIRIQAILKLLWSGLRFCCCGLGYYFDCCLDYCSAAAVLAAVLFATVCGLGWLCCGFGCAVIFILWARLWFYRFTVVSLSRCCSFGCGIIVVVSVMASLLWSQAVVCVVGVNPSCMRDLRFCFLSPQPTAWSRLRSYHCGLGYSAAVVSAMFLLLWMRLCFCYCGLGCGSTTMDVAMVLLPSSRL